MPELLRLLLLVPLAAAIIAALLGPRRTAAVRWVSLLATVFCAVLALFIAVFFALDPSAHPPHKATTFYPAYATLFNLLPLGASSIQFYIGLDGLNVWLVVLTTILMVPSVLISWKSSQVQQRVHEYFAWLLALETALLGVFLSFDIVLFYLFFELTLVPLFFLIGIWGGPERRYAARKFFIFTLTGSLVTLLGVLGVVLAVYSDPHIGQLTFSIPKLVTFVNERLTQLNMNPVAFATELASWRAVQFWVFLAMMVGFAIKVPLVPVHTWLPLAHVEAPTAGSVLLAGVLLKIGCYGFLRLCLPLAPDASYSLGVPLIGWLSVVGIIYGAFCALAQEDFKKLVAYSSVSHLGFCMLGMFALNAAGLSGSLLQMVNHGLSTGGLFLLVGMLYERYHTRLIDDYGGMGARLRVLACFMVFVALTSVGLPGLNGFVGEALIFLGMYDAQPVMAIAATAGIVLGAWYLLRLLLRVFFGALKEPAADGHDPVQDLDFREWACLVPISVCCLFIGVYPQPLLHTSAPAIQVVADIAERAKDRANAPGSRIASTEPIELGKAVQEKPQ